EGKGAIFSICGETGIGKTRLVEEFKETLDLNEIQWLDGQAYAYAQNIPYFPLIDLFNRGFQIKEGDTPEKVREKIESGVEPLIGKREDVIPYVGSLYSLSYPEIEEVSPEFWKSRLQEGIHAILSGLAQRAPTVICLEDLHWSDPSFIDLLRFVLSEFRYPALFICVYRPTISLFTSHQLSGLKAQYQEILLQDLSLSEAQIMLESLLKAKEIPRDLWRFIRENVGGNPFYLEEIINALIETGALSRNNGAWSLDRPISQMDLPSTIHGIIAARLDHLEGESKRILQEASVIGRTFLYDLLKNCTNLKEQLDRNLTRLERLDLIHARSLQPDLEYVFKSALTQEVVYNGLLKKERQAIHERIALVMEQLFRDRIPEFYETLAFHFTQGQSVIKAVNYLVKSGEKSLARYSVEEAHEYFRKAFDILASKEDKLEEEKIILIDILNSWGYAFYYLGNIKEFINLFNSHKDLAESLDDKAKIGMFYVWLGVALFMSGKPKDSFDCLSNALELGEISSNQKVVGYACTWLSWACAELGLLDAGIGFGERAQTIAESFPSDQYLFFKSLGGLSYINNMKGDTKKVFEGAELLLDYSEKTSNNRSKVFGHWVNSWGHLLTGDIELSQKSAEKAVEIALDPFYALFPKISLSLAYFFGGQFQKVEDVQQSALESCEKYEIGQLSELSYLSLAPALISKGHMKEGLRMLEKNRETLFKNQRRVWYAQSEYILGKIYSQIATGPTPAFSVMTKNVGFLVKNAPFAGKKAEEHFNKAIDIFKEIGSKGFLGTACLDLGLLYKNKKRTDQARNYISEAIDIFQETEAKVYLEQAKEALESLRQK
ncbi:MAG: AAA family ATPase, partial [Deltaproteobacteria bacterium]|nr:AAA family ATPase [Deltaproteobacteria bacterium]